MASSDDPDGCSGEEKEGNSMKTLTARNPSEARGIRKALKAAGMKFEFKSTRAGVRKKRNPSKKRRTKKARRAKARRRR